MAMGLGAIENAVLDAKAKRLGVPCCDLFGGRVRDAIRVYWSPLRHLAHRSARLPTARQ